MTEVEGALLLLEVLKQLGEICCENQNTMLCNNVLENQGNEGKRKYRDHFLSLTIFLYKFFSKVTSKRGKQRNF